MSSIQRSNGANGASDGSRKSQKRKRKDSDDSEKISKKSRENDTEVTEIANCQPALIAPPPAPPALDCSICFESIVHRGTLDSCDHPFCFECIQEWSQSANTCPLCKSRFSTITKKALVVTEIPTAAAESSSKKSSKKKKKGKKKEQEAEEEGNGEEEHEVVQVQHRDYRAEPDISSIVLQPAEIAYLFANGMGHIAIQHMASRLGAALSTAAINGQLQQGGGGGGPPPVAMMLGGGGGPGLALHQIGTPNVLFQQNALNALLLSGANFQPSTYHFINPNLYDNLGDLSDSDEGEEEEIDGEWEQEGNEGLDHHGLLNSEQDHSDLVVAAEGQGEGEVDHDDGFLGTDHQVFGHVGGEGDSDSDDSSVQYTFVSPTTMAAGQNQGLGLHHHHHDIDSDEFDDSISVDSHLFSDTASEEEGEEIDFWDGVAPSGNPPNGGDLFHPASGSDHESEATDSDGDSDVVEIHHTTTIIPLSDDDVEILSGESEEIDHQDDFSDVWDNDAWGIAGGDGSNLSVDANFSPEIEPDQTPVPTPSANGEEQQEEEGIEGDEAWYDQVGDEEEEGPETGMVMELDDGVSDLEQGAGDSSGFVTASQLPIKKQPKVLKTKSKVAARMKRRASKDPANM